MDDECIPETKNQYSADILFPLINIIYIFTFLDRKTFPKRYILNS